jgi:hypothetical protein
MHGKKLIELGKAIGEILKAMKAIDIEMSSLDREVEATKLRLVPEGGWPGKNAEERGIAANKAYSNDEGLDKMISARISLDNKKTVLEGDVALLSEERRGIEFAVRDALATALGGYLDDETAKVLDISIDKAALDMSIDDFHPVPVVENSQSSVNIPKLEDAVIKAADGSFELPPIPEGTPYTKVETKPAEEGGPVRFDPEKKEFVKDESFDPSLDEGIPEIFRKKPAPTADIEKSIGKKEPAEKPVGEPAEDKYVEDILKEMGL